MCHGLACRLPEVQALVPSRNGSMLDILHLNTLRQQYNSQFFSNFAKFIVMHGPLKKCNKKMT